MAVPGGIGGSGNLVQQAMRLAQQTRTNIMNAQQESSLDSYFDSVSELSNPFAARMRSKQKGLKDRRRRVSRKEKHGEKMTAKKSISKIRSSAEKFSDDNPELSEEMLEILRSYIEAGDKKEDILRKTQEFYSDVSLADDAMSFLAETTGGELKEEVLEAQKDFNERFGREIIAGKNVSAQARSFSEKGLGSPTALRDMYRDYTGNPRDPRMLFDELTQQFPYKKMSTVIRFLLNSVGSDLRNKGPSIPRGLLHNLLQQTRTLQMILGVYRFFHQRERLLRKLFGDNHLEMNDRIHFENMAKQFMALSGDRYPSSDRILQMARQFGLSDKELLAKIFLFSQFRDAIGEVAADKIFRSIQHRQDLYQAIIEALEELEDELEQMEEEEYRRKKEEEEEGDH